MMKRVEIDPAGPSKDQLQHVADVIEAGGIIVIPSETVYGIACDVFSEGVVAKIFAIKGRQSDNPLPVIVADGEQLGMVVRHVPETARPLIERFWPGPLTLVMDAHPDVPLAVTAATGTVGVRMPYHPVALAVMRAAGRPLACTSANLSGERPGNSVDELDDEVLGAVDLVVDAGETQIGVPSTVLDLTHARPRLLRAGTVTVEQLEGAAGVRVAR